MKPIRIFLIFIVLFLLVTVGSGSFESLSDGNDTLGFPFPFYEYLGGKRDPEPLTRHIFSAGNLCLDVAILLVISSFCAFLLSGRRREPNRFS